eukprot:c20310_g1_i1.p1 GENE.c20310_g1_i1~~c20310_g1_i1.p1  ORF type:complete len:379 (+),score=112.64 c20310_g1_i1:116-1252(+)
MAQVCEKRAIEDVVQHSDEEQPKKRAKVNRDNSTHEHFEQVFKSLEIEVMAQMSEMPGISSAIGKELVAYYSKCLEYTVLGGKMTRGLTVVKGCHTLLGGLSAKQLHQACVLGWCLEWLQAMFLIADDVMDKSITRRGAPCWYKRREVTEANAINDSLLIESMVYQVLRHHFRSEPYYARLIDLVHEVSFQTGVGQHLDTNGTPFDKSLDLNRFTMDRYQAVVRYKTAYYSFFLPCALAMVFAGESDECVEQAKSICVELGEYFQIQDDVLDCFGDPEVIGKIGTDIQDAKCSWLVCQALVRASPEQRSILESNYGKWDSGCVEQVKGVYKQLKLEEAFAELEEQAKIKIDAMIDAFEPASLRPLFSFLLAKVYRRRK